MARVELEHIHKVFADGTRAVDDLSLTIGEGELMVVVGSSGCGKSTVLRLLAGLETPTAGTIRIDGRIVNDHSPQLRNVAMVFQDYALYPNRTVRGNLEFPLRMRRTPADERRRRVEQVAELLEIIPLLERLPRQLSGGQRQRVAMGRALVREPTVFLLDEPLSNLDARLRSQVRAEIGDLQRRTATTMVYVTHDQVEAMTLGHRVAVMHQGRLQQVAPPGELYESPANAFVAGFIGNPPMSLFPAELREGPDGRLGLLLGEDVLPLSPGRLAPERLRALAGKPLTAGVRPEALREAGSDEDGSFLAVPGQIERLGHETLVEVRCGGTNTPVRLVARLAASVAVVRDAPIRLRIDPAAIYLFE